MAGVIPGNKIYGDMSTTDAVRTMSLDADNARREMEAEENKKFKAARGPRTLTNIIKSRFSTGKQPPSESSDDKERHAYSGALLFVAFLGEMRNPWDFWKGLFLAQGFICFVYILFGVFVYSNFGQYSASNIGNVIQPFGLQTAQNIIALLTSFFAIFLYFNIGMKTVYLEVFQEIFNFPAITTRKGQWCWYALGPVYWILAFVVAAAVPNLNGIVNLVGGLFGLNFTYSLPGIMFVGYLVQRGASLPGEGFDPVTGQTTRHDSGMKRWVRGYKKYFLINTFTTLYFLAGLACSGMGTWAAIEGLIQVFGPGGTVATSFGCAVPV
ncbi:hypothetical protein KC349_g5248 [Hortaea werneckii]|nr:hypothetical protein KC349_g5248 [Hortaea werneckii]